PVGFYFSPQLRVFFRKEAPPNQDEAPPNQDPSKFRLWDLASDKPRGPVVRNFQEPLKAVGFSQDQKLFVTGVVQLWNTDTRMQVGRPLWKGAALPAFAPDSKKLLLTFTELMEGNMENRTQQWLLDVPQPVRGTPEYLRLWIEVLTVSEQDSSGGVTE